MASQLDAQYELNKAADRRTRRAEADLQDVEQKLRQLDRADSTHGALMLQQDKVCMRSGQWVTFNTCIGVASFGARDPLDYQQFFSTSLSKICLQCFDAVGRAAGTSSGL